jgi:hypothetical protein
MPPSSRIDRPWLRRIPGYKERRGRKQSEDGEPGEGSTPDPDGNAAAEDEQGEPTETQGEAGEQPPREAGSPPENGAPGSGEGDDSDKSDEIPPDLDLSLDIPDEVEQARKEREKQGGAWNRFHAPRAFPLEGRYLRGLAARFARMVSKLAEDHADLPDDGDDEWDLNALVRRRFTGKLPNQCRMSRDKRKVVVVLDTSPSCAHQAKLFGSIAQVAEELGDCEIFDAPNFGLEARWETGRWEPLPQAERDWPFRQRVVLAFGDFDGIEHICAASKQRGNRIYWFCCEERAPVLESQREFFVRQYKGKYFAANQIQQLMRQMGKVR